jgi:AraC family transcriptional regulator of adaptative response / DNA-3-methyladenine glycosylase II
VPFEVGPAIALLAAGSVPGAEIVDIATARCTRLISTASAGAVAVTVTLHADHVDLAYRHLGSTAAAEILGTVRRWLDLEIDHSLIRQALGADPGIGHLVTARPGLRAIGYPDGFEAAVLIVLGQHVSVRAARTFSGRLVSAFGAAGPAGLQAFPTPKALAAATPIDLQAAIGITHSRARTVHLLAAACADGLVINPLGDHAAIRRELLALPGIGPWTVETLAVRALGDRNAFPAGDLVLQRALGVRTPAAAIRAAENWAPYRAYGLFHLWSAALGI